MLVKPLFLIISHWSFKIENCTESWASKQSPLFIIVCFKRKTEEICISGKDSMMISVHIPLVNLNGNSYFIIGCC